MVMSDLLVTCCWILLMCSSCLLYFCRCVHVFFFFKQKTAYEMRISDWSSDVCSSDLRPAKAFGQHMPRRIHVYALRTQVSHGAGMRLVQIECARLHVVERIVQFRRQIGLVQKKFDTRPYQC